MLAAASATTELTVHPVRAVVGGVVREAVGEAGGLEGAAVDDLAEGIEGGEEEDGVADEIRGQHFARDGAGAVAGKEDALVELVVHPVLEAALVAKAEGGEEQGATPVDLVEGRPLDERLRHDVGEARLARGHPHGRSQGVPHHHEVRRRERHRWVGGWVSPPPPHRPTDRPTLLAVSTCGPEGGRGAPSGDAWWLVAGCCCSCCCCCCCFQMPVPAPSSFAPSRGDRIQTRRC